MENNLVSILAPPKAVEIQIHDEKGNVKSFILRFKMLTLGHAAYYASNPEQQKKMASAIKSNDAKTLLSLAETLAGQLVPGDERLLEEYINETIALEGKSINITETLAQRLLVACGSDSNLLLKIVDMISPKTTPENQTQGDKKKEIPKAKKPTGP